MVARRIWIVVDALECSAGAIAAAHRLAGERPNEIAGVFVEDADLLRLASWPAATEIDALGSVRRALASGRLEQALGAQAAALRRKLDVLGRGLGVRTSFRTARGRLLEEALGIAANHDWIVLAGAAARVRLPSGAAASPRPSVLWLLPENEEALPRLLEAAGEFDAAAFFERRVVLPEDRSRAAEICRLAAAAGSPVEPLLASYEDLLSRAAAHAGDLVLATRQAVRADRGRVLRLLRSGVGPFLLL